MENWLVINKKADFGALSEKFSISPLVARLIRNRDVVTEEEFEQYLSGDIRHLNDPHLLKDVDRLCAILKEKIEQQKKIQIIGDYDIDGVMATYILYEGISKAGGKVFSQIPHRMTDGYGINMHLIEQAKEQGIDTIVTCDNGIAAISEIAYAKEQGITVLVTDHHEIAFDEKDGEKQYIKSEADAIVNPKQPDCDYPFKGLCGAAVAWKVIQVLFELCRIPVEESYKFLENVAFATVGDVMDLVEENRILVKEGLKCIHKTQSPGMRALILQNNLTLENVNAYHFGFVLGPCINASGRLDTARKSLELFLEKDVEKAAAIARELVELNIQRKDMTAESVEIAKEQVEKECKQDKVLVVYLPDTHESLAGIIAGRIRETYHKPVFVLTDAEDGIKGSGRSIEEYSMYEELCKCKELLTKFGGHPMAAGLSLRRENLTAFKEKINAECKLLDEDFIPKIRIDIAMPVGYPDASLVRELNVLEPFGKGNTKPLFADKDLKVKQMVILGKNRNVLRLTLETVYGENISAVYFGDVEGFLNYYREKFGKEEVEAAFLGKNNKILIQIVYYPEINLYNGMENMQMVIRNYR